MPSNRAKQRLLGFILSRGGRITSGRNDSLLRWVFEITARERYAHERITELETVFTALESDGDLVLERDDRGKLIAAHVAETANFEHADLEASMFETSEQLWVFLTILMARNTKLRQQLAASGVDEALAMAAEAEHQRDAALRELNELRGALTNMPGPAPEEQESSLCERLAATEAARATAVSRFENLQQMFEEAKVGWAKEKSELRDKLSKQGSRVAELVRNLEAYRGIHRIALTVATALDDAGLPIPLEVARELAILEPLLPERR